MILALLHILFAVAACFALWKLWTSLAGRGRASLIIALGFLIRAFGGEILFWISYLNLPIARSLQLGDGFWFFAVDGPGMLAYTRELIAGGPIALLLIGREIPSHAFIQVFTVFAWALGTFASVAILVNCAAFLATCGVILRLGEPGARGELTRLVALAAMAFGPGTILWSLQLLKDTFFIFLIVAMVACCFSWQELWRAAPDNWRKKAIVAGAMLAVLYMMAGIRWYLAVFFWGAWILFGLLTALAAKRKVAAVVTNALLLVLLGQVVRLGGASDLPQSILRVLDPRPSIAATFRPTGLTKDLSVRRRGFENTPGGTTIHEGRVLEHVYSPGEEVAKQQPMSATTNPHSPATTTTTIPTGRALEPVHSGDKEIAKQRMSETTNPHSTATTATITIPVGRVLEPVHSWDQEIAKQPASKTTDPHLIAKTVAGLTAEFVPRSIGQALGLIRIGGGRGFWLFVELDTLVLDGLLIFSIVVCARRLRTDGRVTPLFVLLLIVFLTTAGPLAYTVNNFGTLFRLRQVIYAILAFLPLTLGVREDASESKPFHHRDTEIAE